MWWLMPTCVCVYVYKSNSHMFDITKHVVIHPCKHMSFRVTYSECRFCVVSEWTFTYVCTCVQTYLCDKVIEFQLNIYLLHELKNTQEICFISINTIYLYEKYVNKLKMSKILNLSNIYILHDIIYYMYIVYKIETIFVGSLLHWFCAYHLLN